MYRGFTSRSLAYIGIIDFPHNNIRINLILAEKQSPQSETKTTGIFLGLS